jgi:hypothetical protein
MKNYHYYLKQEIHPHGSQRFNGLYWHPEDPLKLYLAGDGGSILRFPILMIPRLHRGSFVGLGGLLVPFACAMRHGFCCSR